MERKETEAGRLSAARESHKMSAKMEALDHQVKELMGFKKFATNKIAELKQQVKRQNVEHEQTKKELTDAKQFERLYKLKADEFIPYQEKTKCLEKELEKQKNENEKLKRKYNSVKDKMHRQTKEIRVLNTIIENAKDEKVSLQHQMANMKEECQAKDLCIKMQSEEAEKQRIIMAKMEEEKSKNKDQKQRLDHQRLEASRQVKTKDSEITNLRMLIGTLESKQRHQMNEMELTKADKNLLCQNLFKAQEEISGQKTDIHKLTDENRELRCKINSTNAEFHKIKGQYSSLKSHLQMVTEQLSMAKRSNEIITVAADREEILGKKNLAHVEAGKNKTERELLLCKQQTLQLQNRIDVLKAENKMLEDEIKELRTEMKCLRLDNKDLEAGCHQVKTAFKTENLLKLKIHPQKQDPACFRLAAEQHRQCPTTILNLEQRLEEEVKKNEELAKKLERRPEDAAKQLFLWQHDYKKLNEKCMGLQAMVSAYQDSIKLQELKINQLTYDLGKLKLEVKDHNECGRVSRNTRFPLIGQSDNKAREIKSQPPVSSDVPQHRLERKKFVPLPPISSKSQGSTQ